MKKGFILVMIMIFSLTASGYINSGSVYASEKGKIVYNKYNIHIQQKSTNNITAHCANWTGPFTGHGIIPPNTQIKILPWRNGFTLVQTDTGHKIKFIFASKYMDMDKEKYIDTIFSINKVSLDGLSSLDLKGVEQGKALKGMSRQGVMTALGYPAAHKTPSLNGREWIYWTNRFGTKAVLFDSSGKVSGVRN
ncbi:MAG: hypothetical protein KOO64_11280 [Desulfobacterales bacterium]|nr:hypothetical protein [Desulfobacterales bacterium]